MFELIIERKYRNNKTMLMNLFWKTKLSVFDKLTELKDMLGGQSKTMEMIENPFNHLK